MKEDFLFLLNFLNFRVVLTSLEEGCGCGWESGARQLVVASGAPVPMPALVLRHFCLPQSPGRTALSPVVLRGQKGELSEIQTYGFRTW